MSRGWRGQSYKRIQGRGSASPGIVRRGRRFHSFSLSNLLSSFSPIHCRMQFSLFHPLQFYTYYLPSLFFLLRSLSYYLFFFHTILLNRYLIRKTLKKSEVWFRYVDDTFVIWRHGRTELRNFLNIQSISKYPLYYI